MEKDRNPNEQAQEERSLAMDMLRELKNTVVWQRKAISRILVVGIAVVIGLVGGFLIYLSQYDYVNTYEVEANGIYTAASVEKNSTNIISQDVSQETWELFMEWLNGQGESTSDQGAN